MLSSFVVLTAGKWRSQKWTGSKGEQCRFDQRHQKLFLTGGAECCFRLPTWGRGLRGRESPHFYGTFWIFEGPCTLVQCLSKFKGKLLPIFDICYEGNNMGFGSIFDWGRGLSPPPPTSYALGFDEYTWISPVPLVHHIILSILIWQNHEKLIRDLWQKIGNRNFLFSSTTTE